MQEWIRPRIGLGRKEALTQARRLLRRERLYHIDMPRSIVNMDADPIALFLDELEMGALLQVRPILHIELDLLELSHDQLSFIRIHFNHHHPSYSAKEVLMPSFFAYFCFDSMKLSEINCPFYGT